MDAAVAHGLTHLLVTKADGTKLGKTETGTVWLDAEKTSPYEMYQLWLNTADADVVRFFKCYIFLPLATLEELQVATNQSRESRGATRSSA